MEMVRRLRFCVAQSIFMYRGKSLSSNRESWTCTNFPYPGLDLREHPGRRSTNPALNQTTPAGPCPAGVVIGVGEQNLVISPRHPANHGRSWWVWACFVRLQAAAGGGR